MSTALTLYGLAWKAALPLTRIYLRHRAKKQPEYLDHWDERFGSFPYPKADAPRVWLHAVSLGETNAARALVNLMLERWPECELLLTCMTPTGRDAGARIAKAWPGRVKQCYLPYDTPRLMGKFLDETKPRLGILMETEVWPALLSEAKKRGIPMVLANARESQKSLDQANRVKSLMSEAFGSFTSILAQSDADRERIASIGGRNISVCGSVKFDIRPDEAQAKRAQELKAALRRPILLLASTRQGEEAMFAPALKTLPEDVLTVLVPRHPQRFEEVARELETAEIRFVRKSRTEDLLQISPDTQVLLGDTMGEMSFYCALADLTVMGGSFGNFGSQNLIEPAAAGSPVILGPSTFNFAKVAEDALKVKAALQVDDAASAIRLASELFASGRLPGMREDAMRFAGAYTGAAEKMFERLDQLWKRQSPTY
jgi:3-deoxy-D-manno-octulosonic-acid transferase